MAFDRETEFGNLESGLREGAGGGSSALSILAGGIAITGGLLTFLLSGEVARQSELRQNTPPRLEALTSRTPRVLGWAPLTSLHQS